MRIATPRNTTTRPLVKLGRQVIQGHLDRAGVNLHYLGWNPDQGSRPAVLLLHGLSSNAAFWTRLAGHLTSRLVALDQRAHGASAAPEDGYQPATLAADAAALVEELGLGPVVVAGHSWGASIALQLAADRPDLVAGLAVIDGPVRAWSEIGVTWDQAVKFMQPPLPPYRDLEAALAEKRVELKDAWADDLVEFVRSGLVAEGTGFRLPLTPPIRLQILQAMFFQPYEVLWTQVRCPVLLALADGGGQSGFLDYKRRSAAEVVEQVPGTVVHWYPTGHDIPLERPAEMAAELERLCLRAGFAEVSAEILATDGDWSRPTGYQDWTAKDLLAHLSSTQAALPAVAQSRPEPGAGPPVKFDSDRWNASQVRRRAERTAAELKAELDAGRRELDPLLAELPIAETVGAGPFAGESTAAAMAYMVDHQRDHLAELRRTLG
jgi:pimeloyl-ACP methyl ester carboxylesterase